MATSAHQISALSDATRRRIFEILSEGPTSVADLAEQLPVSRPAVSQHLRVLSDVGLVMHRVEGARHVYRLDPSGVAALRDYLDSIWQIALDQFKTEAERPPKTKRKRR